MIVGAPAVMSTFQTGGKGKEKEGMAFPLVDTFWNSYMQLLLMPHWPEFNCTAPPAA